MKSAIQDLPIIFCVALFGLGSLASIVFLSFNDHVIPSEITNLPAVALGILGGVVVGAKRTAVVEDAGPVSGKHFARED